MSQRVKLFGHFVEIYRGRKRVCCGRSCEFLSDNPTEAEIRAAKISAQRAEESRLARVCENRH